jgi:hypothetical protein
MAAMSLLAGPVVGGGAHAADLYTGQATPLKAPECVTDPAAFPIYASVVAHDSATLFVSMPLDDGASCATISPYCARHAGAPWMALHFFRAHITQAQIRHAPHNINAYRAARCAERVCRRALSLMTACSLDVTNYELSDCGMIHEVSRGGPGGNISQAVHVSGLGTWQVR